MDVTLSGGAEQAKQIGKMIEPVVAATLEQYPGIFITPPSMEGITKTQAGKVFLRIKFRIWPGRGTPIETNLKPEIVQSLKKLDPNYADWMVAINYEVEKRAIPLTFRDFPRKNS